MKESLVCKHRSLEFLYYALDGQTLCPWAGYKSVLRNVICFASLSGFVPLRWLWKCHLTVWSCLWERAPLSPVPLAADRAIICFVPTWYGHLCFVSHTFSETRSCTLRHVLYDCTQPRPPSALASVASESRTSHAPPAERTCAHRKRWTRPSKKHLITLSVKEDCLLAARLLVCCIAWTELSTNEAAYHVRPEKKSPLLQLSNPLIRAFLIECHVFTSHYFLFFLLYFLSCHFFFYVSLLIVSVCHTLRRP